MKKNLTLQLIARHGGILRNRVKKVIKKSPKLGELISVTSGGSHGWYHSNLGYPIRKPLQ